MKAGCIPRRLPILCVIPFCAKDWDAAIKLLLWMEELGGCKRNPCLLVAANEVKKETIIAVRNAAGTVFESVKIAQPKHALPDESWPRGANWLFATACAHADRPFFWCEADNIPLKPNWLEWLEHEYYTQAKPFMGTFGPGGNFNGKPFGACVNGCAIYPADAGEYFQKFDFAGVEPWDLWMTPRIMPQTHNSPMIQHFFGEMGLAPTFRQFHAKGEPRNVFTLEQIRKDAMCFHRCKDGTLIDLLRDRRTSKTRTVFHSGDLGDIVYGMLFAKTLGKVRLILGPNPNHVLREQMTVKKFEWLKDLFASQAWIESVEFSVQIPKVDYDLNDFRQTWFSSRHPQTLWQAYGLHFGVRLSDTEPWFKVDPIVIPGKPVVISRSKRYRNEAFPWKSASARYNGRMVFVGLIDEYEDWIRRFGKTAEYRQVSSALEMAQIIAGAKLFIGNQSFANALALAIGIPVIQETFLGSPDCVFRRPNVQCTDTKQPIQWPNIEAEVKRHVVNRPNSKGEIELGPMSNALALGDTLSITAVAAALPKPVVLLPPHLARFGALFDGICPVRFTEDYPVFPFLGGHVIEEKMRVFGLDGHNVLPIVRLRESEKEAARKDLAGFTNPIGLCPSCSKGWEHIRGRPVSFFVPIVKALSKRFTVLQFGREDYPSIPGCVRPRYMEPRTLAAWYAIMGRYVGLNTGDYHLALAVGCKAIVIDPDGQEGYDPRCWRYPSCDRVRYTSFVDPENTIRSIPFLL